MTQRSLFDVEPEAAVEDAPPSVESLVAKARRGARDWTLTVGDSRDVLATWPDACVDAVVCDPPYELGFMGKKWDASGIAFDVGLWREVLRVLKPGGHMLAFSGTRTQHRMVCAIEDAGFEVRDQIGWAYSTGFPKSLDVSKAIDKAAGAEREVIGTKRGVRGADGTGHESSMPGKATGIRQVSCDVPVTAPATDAARQWSGWGTALKPAWEPVCVARRPLDGTVAQNVITHGTGALNVDACRVGTDGGGTQCTNRDEKGRCLGHKNAGRSTSGETFHGPNTESGRWPANLIHDGSDEVGALLGDAARFFYCAKAARSEREHGLDTLPAVRGHEAVDRAEGSAGVDNPRAGAGRTAGHVRNIHPTVKPVDLMRYLVTLVTPTGGIVLDPFAGSGSTGIGALLAGCRFRGIELDTAHACIAWHRMRWWDDAITRAGLTP